MKLSTFARRAGICYKTAWRWWKTGKIKGYQMETGTVLITEEITEHPGQERVVGVYARVSATENPIEEIIADLASMLYSFCARLYRQRRAKRKTEKIVQDLNVQAQQPVPQEAGEQRAAR